MRYWTDRPPRSVHDDGALLKMLFVATASTPPLPSRPVQTAARAVGW